ncbi:hypothetical protein OU994_20500 [Pseudoduganella sp. SL102]|uniref:hypothetical protein n=1 Tax=Pseudoduganella sp. SL102 TaxID=2995154 RepID=UPI00248BA94E|nr:hypothetical protein [Pseudoduganella sp. SL102]WBS00684.1 hypothetical protein OU994_20500 [Pseudoduganella sp. SL102]
MKDMNTVYGMAATPAHVEHPRTPDYVKPVTRVCAYAMLAMLIGYTVQLINAVGDISVQEKNVILFCSAVTLLLIIPIIGLNIYFVSRHRASSTAAENSSPRLHAIGKEAASWAKPVAIIAVLTLLSWGGTHSLDLIR